MKFLTTNAHFLLRISLASVFIYHGALKFMNLEGFAQMLPISYFMVVLVALAETSGGLLVLLGGFRDDAMSDLATRIGAALNFLPSETHPMGGYQFQAVLILVSLYLVITGNQGFSESKENNIQTA